MTKNWNDRADKDLFFTILSVKNIGVISGAEWTVIGSYMRTLGYGFTNEGCRYVPASAAPDGRSSRRARSQRRSRRRGPRSARRRRRGGGRADKVLPYVDGG